MNTIKLSVIFLFVFLSSCTRIKNKIVSYIQPYFPNEYPLEHVKDTALSNVPKLFSDSSKKVLSNDTLYDYLASFLAHKKNEVFTDSAYQLNKQPFTQYEKQFNQKFYEIQAWTQKEMPENGDTGCVFYPFSGPDFFHVFSFFPKANTYVLSALEPIGYLPDIHSLNTQEVIEYQTVLLESLKDVFKRSYFITKHMDESLRKNKSIGVLPVLCISLKFAGFNIISIKPIEIENEGTVRFSNPNIMTNLVKGIEIQFEDTIKKSPKKLYYFSLDMSNEKQQKDSSFLKYVDRLPPFYCYLKSASYLLHYAHFSCIRERIMNHATLILQDDSGLPYHVFLDSIWDINLYGKYYPPIKDFKHIYEPKLEEAYRKDNNIEELPFDIGYRWGQNKQNLLLARRKIK